MVARPAATPDSLPASGFTLTAVGHDIVAFGGLANTSAGPRPTAAAHTYAGGRWRPLVPETEQVPAARSGHTSCVLNTTSMIVFGGRGSGHEKFADVWQLRLSTTAAKQSVWLELELDAWSAERAARESSNATKAEPPAKNVLDLDRVAQGLGGVLGGLPADCFDVSLTSSDAATAETLKVSVSVRPLVGVGLGKVGADGEDLPIAVISALETRLRSICPLDSDGAAEGKASPRGTKGAKGGGGDAKAAMAAAARARAQLRVLGCPLLGWHVERRTRVAAVPCVRWSRVADDQSEAEPKATVVPTGRTGHSMSSTREGMILFGGSSSQGLVADLWLLKVRHKDQYRRVISYPTGPLALTYMTSGSSRIRV